MKNGRVGKVDGGNGGGLPVESRLRVLSETRRSLSLPAVLGRRRLALPASARRLNLRPFSYKIFFGPGRHGQCANTGFRPTFTDFSCRRMYHVAPIPVFRGDRGAPTPRNTARAGTHFGPRRGGPWRRFRPAEMLRRSREHERAECLAGEGTSDVSRRGVVLVQGHQRGQRRCCCQSYLEVCLSLCFRFVFALDLFTSFSGVAALCFVFPATLFRAPSTPV
jgi:hypothetical protein